MSDTINEWLAAPPADHPPAKRPGIQKVSYTHDALIDLILAHPEWTQNQFAAHFGYTASWVSIIMSSDAFQSRLADRRAELVDPVLIGKVEANFRGMILRSQAVLMEKMNKPAAEIKDNLALRVYELSNKAAGYGARPVEPKVQVNVTNHLEQLGGNLEALLRRKRHEAEEPIDVSLDDQGREGSHKPPPGSD